VLRSCVFVFLAVVSPVSRVFAGGVLVPVRLYEEVSRYVLSCRYAEAEKAAVDFMRRYPEEPAGPLFKAAVLQYECTDYEDFSREDEFMALVGGSMRLARRKLEDGDDLWARYYLAAAAGLRGSWTVASGKLIRGVVEGASGARGMEKIVEADSTFYDAYLLLGSYRFWRNVALSRLSWLPFIGGGMEECIAEVSLAVERGMLTGALGNTVLLEMLLEYDPSEAVVLGERLANEYPGCRLFSWQLGEAYKKSRRYDEAVRIFTGIADTMAADGDDDGSGELRCWWKLAVLARDVGNMTDCRYYCRKVLELGERETVRESQARRIEGARKMLGGQ